MIRMPRLALLSPSLLIALGCAAPPSAMSPSEATSSGSTGGSMPVPGSSTGQDDSSTGPEDPPAGTDPSDSTGMPTTGSEPTSSTGSTSDGTDGTTAGDHDEPCLIDIPANSPSTLCVPQFDSDLVTACGLTDGSCMPGCELDVSLSDLSVSVAFDDADNGVVTRTITAEVQLTADVPVDYTVGSCTALATMTGPLTFTQRFTPPADCDAPQASDTNIELSLGGEASGCNGLAGFAGIFSDQLVPHIEDFVQSELEAELTVSSCTHCADACEFAIACSPQ